MRRFPFHPIAPNVAPKEWRQAASAKPRTPTSDIRGHLAPRDLAVARDEVLIRVEAALFAAEEPLTPRKLARLAGLADTGEARRQVDRLNRLLRKSGSAFIVDEVASGYQMLTCPELRTALELVYRPGDELQLSPPTLETLAIVAYRQPICRADIEAIRGVQVGEILKQLMDKGLVKFAGKDDSLGRPYLYGTTNRFLQAFGLRNLHELPLVELLSHPQVDDSSNDEQDEETPSDGPTQSNSP